MPPTSKQASHLARLEEQAPDRCEMCDCSLPTFASRLEHIEDTGHCACRTVECWRYIPPGYVYQHFCAMHEHENWNEHQISGGDASTLREALPWVREEYQRRMAGHIDVNQWLGLNRIGERSEAFLEYKRKLEEGEKKFDARRLAQRKRFVKKRKEQEEAAVEEKQPQAQI